MERTGMDWIPDTRKQKLFEIRQADDLRQMLLITEKHMDRSRDPDGEACRHVLWIDGNGHGHRTVVPEADMEKFMEAAGIRCVQVSLPNRIGSVPINTKALYETLTSIMRGMRPEPMFYRSTTYESFRNEHGNMEARIRAKYNARMIRYRIDHRKKILLTKEAVAGILALMPKESMPKAIQEIEKCQACPYESGVPAHGISCAQDLISRESRKIRCERTPENKDTDTFDFVRVSFGILSKEACEPHDRRALANRYKDQFIRIAMKDIEENKRFQRYGVPVSYLKVSRMTITAQDELSIVFELKDLPS